MTCLKTIFAILFLTTVVWSKQLQFNNFKVFSVKVETDEQLKVLRNLENDGNGYSYWKDPIIGRIADIVVPPHKLNDFEAIVSALNLNSTLKVANIQE